MSDSREDELSQGILRADATHSRTSILPDLDTR